MNRIEEQAAVASPTSRAMRFVFESLLVAAIAVGILSVGIVIGDRGELVATRPLPPTILAR